MTMHFDQTDYSVVVKNRAPLPKAWKWEIHRAGRGTPIDQSSVCFHTVVTASKAGKAALKQFMDGLFAYNQASPPPNNDGEPISRWDDEGGR
jgi:hypothetical protein